MFQVSSCTTLNFFPKTYSNCAVLNSCKLILLAIWQVIIRETRSKLLVWKDKAPFRTRTTLFIKPADQEPGRLASQRVIFSSVQFSRSVGANSLRPHESQHTRPPCPSPTPGVHSDSLSHQSFFIQNAWTARRLNQSIQKEISPEYSLAGLMLKLKLQFFGHLMWRTDSLEKILMLGKTEDRRRRGWQRMRWLVASPTLWTWV